MSSSFVYGWPISTDQEEKDKRSNTQENVSSLFERVRQISKNSTFVRDLANEQCVVTFVKWEDTARNKNSSWGPNISDVTLDVEDMSFPIIGTNNYVDKTFDMPIENFVVHVGNEKVNHSNDELLSRISLQEYLMNIEKYTNLKVKDGGSLFLNHRDESLLTSSQATVLPLRDGTIEFNVRIHNYQYDAKDPAVLCVVISPHGTSAQLLTEYKQNLYFNRAGSKVNYRAERLTDQRIKAGKATTDGLMMTQEEQEKNVLFILQIPLKQKPVIRRQILECCSYNLGGEDLRYNTNACFSIKTSAPRGMDHAQLSIGDKTHGNFYNMNSSMMTIERDERFPIRCTIQYYYVTDTAEVPKEMVERITTQVWKHYRQTDKTKRGSLVIGAKKDRITEPALPPSSSTISMPFFIF
jgi:hypothetical protein